MGFLDKLFGGEQETETLWQERLTPEQKKLFNQMLGYITPQMTGQGISAYPGTTVAPTNTILSNVFGTAQGMTSPQMSYAYNYDRPMASTNPLASYYQLSPNMATGLGVNYSGAMSGGTGTGTGVGTGSINPTVNMAPYQQGTNVLAKAMEMNPTWNTDPGAAEEYWRKSFYEPAMQRFKSETLPEIREQFAGSGAYRSGGRNRAETKAMGEMATDLEGKLAELMWGETQAGREAQESAMNRAMQATPLALQYASTPETMLQQALQTGMMGQQLSKGAEELSWLPAQLAQQFAGGEETIRQMAQQYGISESEAQQKLMNSLLGIGTTQRGIEAEPLQEEYQKWLTEQPWNNPYFSQAMQLLNVGATPQIAGTIQSTPWYGQLGSSMLNLGQNAAASWLASLFA